MMKYLGQTLKKSNCFLILSRDLGRHRTRVSMTEASQSSHHIYRIRGYSQGAYPSRPERISPPNRDTNWLAIVCTEEHQRKYRRGEEERGRGEEWLHLLDKRRGGSRHSSRAEQRSHRLLLHYFWMLQAPLICTGHSDKPGQWNGKQSKPREI